MRLALLLLFSLVFVPVGAAATITVTTAEDEVATDGDCSLREAVLAANTDAAVDGCAAGSGADTIRFSTSVTGPVALTIGELVVISDVTLDGTDLADATLTAGDQSRLVRIDAGALRLTALRLTGGRAERGGAVALAAGATLDVGDGVSFAANEATGATAADGGGAIVSDGGTVLLGPDTQIEGNVAAGSGGAVLMVGGRIDRSGVGPQTVTFAGNRAGGDGGALALVGGEIADLTADFLNNAAAGDGGALHTAESTVALDASFVANVAAGDGGALATSGGEADLRALFASNAADGDGGALHTSGGATVALDLLEATTNVARGRGRGGAIFNGDATLDLRGVDPTGTLVAGNAADGAGGGGLFNAGTLRGNSFTVSDNEASGPEGAGGGLLSVGGSVELADVAFRGNRARTMGAGVAGVGAEIVLLDAVVDGNGGGLTDAPNAPVRGGGLSVEGGSLTMRGGATIANNEATTGGGVFVTDGGALRIEDGEVADNRATADGGGVSLASDATGEIVRSDVVGNAAGANGGGLYATGTARLTVDGDLFQANTAGASGGAVALAEEATALLRGVELSENEARGAAEADGGGAIAALGPSLSDPSVVIEDAAIVGNVAAGSGGGVWSAVGASVTVRESVVSGNGAGRDGAGLAINGVLTLTGSATVEVIDSTVSENGVGGAARPARGGGVFAGGENSTQLLRSSVWGNAAGEGGGVWTTGFVDLLVVNSTVSRNTAEGDGGGIFAQFFDPAVGLLSATVAENVAGGRGGGMYARGGAFMITSSNSVLAGNEAPQGPDCFGDLATDAPTAIEDTADCAIESFSGDGSGNVLDVPLGLGPLADNGGPTLTHLPLAGSPLIDAGETPLEVDQRGFKRGVEEAGAADIGSVETNGRPVAVAPVAPGPLALGVPAPNPSAGRVAFSVATGEPAMLEVFDALGKRVRRVAVAPGATAVTLDVSGLAAGVYLARFHAGTAQGTRRFTVVR